MKTDMATGKQLGTFLHTTGLVKPAHVTDGTSKTMMIGEKYARSDRYDGAFGDNNLNSDDRGWTDGWDGDNMRSTCFIPVSDSDPIGWEPSLQRMFGDGGPWPFAGIYNVINFGSPHTGGINSVFADGSVHTISFSIDVVVFNSLGSRNGDETVDTSAVN